MLIYVISSILSIISVSGVVRVNRITPWSMCKNRRKDMVINFQTINICIRSIIRYGKNVGNLLNLR